MFKKLKDKIAEEVKSSPQRIQQIAQAVVSSASSTSSEISGNDTFFSIAEEDTPQNSPQHLNANQTTTVTSTKTPINSSTANINTSSGLNGNLPARRKLSNSSIGSDVSFRLPSYDSPAIYHLQSDLDISASEVEDHAFTTAQLDRVSKEQLHQAYRKSLDKYQKYRRRYTDLARKYSELERENSKARSVLVETQDKALRRISELREQCSLEQQAKAHLEAALRMELDDKDCLIQSLKTKLESEYDGSLMSVSNQSSITSLPQNALIDLTTPSNHMLDSIDSLEASGDTFYRDELKKFEEEIQKYKEQLGSQWEVNTTLENKLKTLTTELTEKNNVLKQQSETFADIKMNYDAKVIEADHYKTVSKDLEANLNLKDEEIKKLKACEEENVLLMAESKQDMHKELENREKEVKILTKKLSDLEKASQENLMLNDKFIALENLLGKEKAEYDGKIKDLKIRVDDLVNRGKVLESDCEKLSKEKLELMEAVKDKDEKIVEYLKEQDILRKDKTNTEVILNKNARDLNDLTNKVTSLDWSIKQLESERIVLIQKCEIITKENEVLTDTKEKLKNVSDTLSLEKQQAKDEFLLMQNKYRDADLTVKQLRQEIDNLKTCNESTETEAICKMKNELKSMREKLMDAEKVCQDLQQNCALLETEKANKDFEIQNIRAAIMILKETLTGAEVSASNKEIEKCTVRELEDKIIDVINHLKQKRDVEKQNDKLLTSQQKINENLGNDIKKLQSKILGLEEANGELEKSLSGKIEELKIAEEKIADLEEKIRENESKLIDVENSKITEIESWKLKNEELSEKSLLATERLTELTKEYDEYKQEIDGKLLEIEQLSSDLSNTSRELTKAYEDLQQLRAENEKLKTEQTTFQKQAQDYDKISYKNSELEKKLKSTINKLFESETELTMFKKNSQRWEQSDTEKEYLNTVIVQMESDLSQALISKENLETKIKEMRADNESKVNSVNTLTYELKKQKDKFDKRSHHLESSLNEKNELNHGLTRSIASLEKEADERKNLVEELKAKLHGLELTNAGLIKQVEVLTVEKNKISEQTEDQIQTLSKTVIEQSEKLATFKNYHEILNENKILKDSMTDTQHSNAQLEKLKTLQETITKLKDDKSYLSKMLTDMEQQNLKKDEELHNIQKDFKNLEERLQDQETLTSRIKHLENINQVQSQEIQEKLNTENNELREKLTECNKSLHEMTELKSNYERYENENKELMLKLKYLEEKYENTEKSIDSKISNLNQEIDCHIERITYLEDKCRDYDAVKRTNVELNQETKKLTMKLSEYELAVGLGDAGKVRDLEIKLSQILNEVSEVSNKNLLLEQKCNNMNLLEATNEKLKLANEKLTRQLDDTLVTRRHSDSITQLTEFEYLRNILYQYLSGGLGNSSANTNSTLVRVIAAVMKFDQNQTQTVLDKEAQKNTLLGQLHLI